MRQIRDDWPTILGRIAASAPVQLFGADRARGFTVPCSTMDACLYAVGYAAWQRHQKPSLPVQFERIAFGRLPDPGEPCLVRIRQTALSDQDATWSFQLEGLNGDRLSLLLLTGAGTAFRLFRDRPDQPLTAALGSMLVVLVPTLLMTGMSYDFGFMIFWTPGILAGLSSAQIRSRLERRSVI